MLLFLSSADTIAEWSCFCLDLHNPVAWLMFCDAGHAQQEQTDLAVWAGELRAIRGFALSPPGHLQGLELRVIFTFYFVFWGEKISFTTIMYYICLRKKLFPFWEKHHLCKKMQNWLSKRLAYLGGRADSPDC